MLFRDGSSSGIFRLKTNSKLLFIQWPNLNNYDCLKQFPELALFYQFYHLWIRVNDCYRSLPESFTQSRGNVQRARGRGGELQNMGYTSMCRSTGYAFFLSDSGTGYKNHPFSLEEGLFYLRLDSRTGSIFPRILINHDKV